MKKNIKKEYDERIMRLAAERMMRCIFENKSVDGLTWNPFGSVYVWVPRENEIIFIQEGSGDQLLDEDREEGYVDYIDYSIKKFFRGDIELEDGGIVLYKECIQDKYKSLAEAIPDVLEEAYDDRKLEYQILREDSPCENKEINGNIVEVSLPNGDKLVAEANYDPDYKEIIVGIISDGVWVQDLAAVGEKYFYENGEKKTVNDEYQILVWADKDQEDWTEKFEVEKYKED